MLLYLKIKKIINLLSYKKYFDVSKLIIYFKKNKNYIIFIFTKIIEEFLTKK